MRYISEQLFNVTTGSVRLLTTGDKDFLPFLMNFTFCRCKTEKLNPTPSYAMLHNLTLMFISDSIGCEGRYGRVHKWCGSLSFTFFSKSECFACAKTRAHNILLWSTHFYVFRAAALLLSFKRVWEWSLTSLEYSDVFITSSFRWFARNLLQWSRIHYDKSIASISSVLSRCRHYY